VRWWGRVRQAQGFLPWSETVPGCQGSGPDDRGTLPFVSELRAGDAAIAPCRSIFRRRGSGDRHRLAGEGGGRRRGRPSGDLYIFLSCGKPRILSGRADLHCRVTIRWCRRVGGAFEVPTIGEKKNQGKTQSENYLGKPRSGRPLSHGIKGYAGVCARGRRRHYVQSRSQRRRI